MNSAVRKKCHFMRRKERLQDSNIASKCPEKLKIHIYIYLEREEQVAPTA